jgi:predicted  nucleic acid-binding Zn-ribbon protein
MPRNQPHLNSEHRYQLEKLHQEIDTIKNNHLVHIAQDIDNLDVALKETKTEIKERFDKLDERMWVIMGLVVTTLATIVLAAVFGA